MQTLRSTPLWRSILFVPAHVERYVARAARTEADAVILDLEDGVALHDKSRARDAVPAAAATLASKGIDVLVRINSAPAAVEQDLVRCRGSDVCGLVLPKVEQVAQIRCIQDLLRARAQQSAPMLLPMIETPRALLDPASLLDLGPQIVGLALGDEDLSAAIGCTPQSDTLQLARQMVVLAAAAHGRLSFALVGSNFRDLESYRTASERARGLGLSGGLCIHPAQVPILNEAFSPSAAEIAAAERVLAAFDDGLGSSKGATAVDGEMVDRPVALRAASLLARARLIHERAHNRRCDPGSPPP